MLRRCAFSSCLFLLLLPAIVCGQQSSPPRDFDFASFLKETQQSANEAGYAGLVWWIPTEYWEISSERSGVPEEKATQRYAPLRKYTVVAVAVGKIGIGNINWVSESDIRDNVRLRDADGNTYPPVQKLSGDAEGLVAVLKAVFGNTLGAMGQNIQLLFFSASNKMAKPIADPTSTGEFSVIVSKIIEGKDKKFEWKLPLTSLSPPKYCPVGKERLQANWKYCPWHGVRLDEPVGTAANPK
ncbi:MAG: hypothetical protein ACJ72H_03170 [Candidatus Sulfotelmatobacter sp.]|jgi:hypothetical protein